MNQADKLYLPAFKKSFFAPKYWPTWLLLALMWVCAYLPRSITGFIGARLGDLFCLLSAKRRHVAQVNIRMCFPELSTERQEWLIRQHFRVYVQCLLDYGLIWWARIGFLKKYIHISGMGHITAEQAKGHNVILLTGHYSALDLGASLVSEQNPTIALIKPAKNHLIDWFMARGRHRFHAISFLRDDGIRNVVRAIKQKKIFYYLPDEDLGPAHAIFVPFLATEAATITAVSKLARITEASVLPCYTRRLPGNRGYEMIVRPPLEDFPTNDFSADAIRVNAELEKGIRDIPEQYMWTLKLFKTRPGKQPSPYDG